MYGDDYNESEEREVIAECEVDIDVRTSGGGGGGRRDRDDDEPTPTPQVLGEQVSVVPLGAADAGAGSTSPIAIPSFGLAAAAFIGRSRK